MRLGAYPCAITKKSLAASIYKENSISERHRHRYEFNNKFKSLLEKKGMIFSGHYKSLDLVEIIELEDHPWFLAVQFHPEFQSRPLSPHPLFRSFVEASLTFGDVKDTPRKKTASKTKHRAPTRKAQPKRRQASRA